MATSTLTTNIKETFTSNNGHWSYWLLMESEHGSWGYCIHCHKPFLYRDLYAHQEYAHDPDDDQEEELDRIESGGVALTYREITNRINYGE